MAGNLTIVLVEDHPMLRKGVEMMLRRRGHNVVGMADNAEQAYHYVKDRRPDVLVTDIGLPGESGVELTRRLLSEDPELAVVLYTGIDKDHELRDALGSGARGLALKSGDPTELIDGIELVAEGGTYFDRRLEPLLNEPPGKGLLSPREREVLALLAQGRTNEAAAGELFLSEETVRTHVRNAMRKLDAHTRLHAVVLALASGEIRAEPGG